MKYRDRIRVLMPVAICVTVVGLWLSGSVVHSADAGPAAKDLQASWKDGGRKLADMAADFPENKYDWKPTPDVRSFAEQLLHAASYANYVTEVAKGLKPKEQDPPRSNFKSKADIVAYVKKAYADGAKVIEATSDAKLLSAIEGAGSKSLYGLFDSAVEHTGEHYGQLVVYYRVNKMVPPESRPRK
jgi:hypothetical protein